MPTSRPRRHSLSSGDESFYPHPAKAGGHPRLDSRRRARLPRSKSTSNVFDALNGGPGTTDRYSRNIAFEQADIDTLRELAKFLRTTGPPPERPIAHDECLRFSGSSEPRRWSLQSLRRNKRTKLQRHSFQVHLPDNIIPGTTPEGQRYMVIPTPAPNNAEVDGPYFRSQYPVFLAESQLPPPRPHTSPKLWPERSSSKAASSSIPDKGTASGEVRNSPNPTPQPGDELLPRALVLGHARARALSHRISTDRLLRAMINPADEEIEQDITASLMKLGSQKVPGMEYPHQNMPLGAVREEDTDLSEGSPRAVPTRMASRKKASLNGTSRPTRSISLESRAPPRSPERSLKPLANILVRGGLAVPKDNVAPESPGFPNMLAKMTFPSPPKGSRPSSPASTSPSVAEGQASPSFRPTVQPRTSSKRTHASTSASAASLDEMVMQKRPSPRRVQSDRITQTGMMPAPAASTAARFSTSRSPTTPLEHATSSGGIGGAEQNPRSHSTEPFRGEQSVSSGGGGGEECQRESLTSQLTATTESSQQSILTYRTSSSSVSELSAQSKSTITAETACVETTEISRRVGTPLPEGRPNMEDAGFKTAPPEGAGVGLTDTGNPDIGKEPENPTRPRLWLSTTSDPNRQANPQPQSIIERRLARKAKVREYKMRDLDASRADVVDSPILGYFARNLPPGEDSAPQDEPVAVNGPRRPSSLSMATIAGEAPDEALQISDIKEAACLHDEPPSKGDISRRDASTETPQITPMQLKLSAVVATSIEPIYPKAADWQTSGITMSPIMVVADVESRPGSPTLRFSVLARPESASPRTMGRLKPLKISPHSRQKSHTVTISRNPSTGLIERSASGPSDNKFNRRSLIAMPTPPMSPEATHLSKRLSLPPLQLNLPLTPRSRTPPSRRQEWHTSPAEERGFESRVRSATLKERVMREKMQKEKEITEIVAKTVGLSQKHTTPDDEDTEPLPLEQNNTETLEKRLERLERNNDAWLSAMKPLLEAMARTLDDMRADDRSSSLAPVRMSDFVIDMDAEARRVTHSRRGDKDGASAMLPSSAGLGFLSTKTNNIFETFSPTPLSPVLQELDDVPVADSQAPPPTAPTTGESPAAKEQASTTPANPAGPEDTPEGLEARASEAIQRRMLEQESMMRELSKSWGVTSSVSSSAQPSHGTDKKTIPMAGSTPDADIDADADARAPAAVKIAVVGDADDTGEPDDWQDLDPFIRELGSMPRALQEDREARKGGVAGPNPANSITQ